MQWCSDATIEAVFHGFLAVCKNEFSQAKIIKKITQQSSETSKWPELITQMESTRNPNRSLGRSWMTASSYAWKSILPTKLIAWNTGIQWKHPRKETQEVETSIGTPISKK